MLFSDSPNLITFQPTYFCTEATFVECVQLVDRIRVNTSIDC